MKKKKLVFNQVLIDYILKGGTFKSPGNDLLTQQEISELTKGKSSWRDLLKTEQEKCIAEIQNLAWFQLVFDRDIQTTKQLLQDDSTEDWQPYYDYNMQNKLKTLKNKLILIQYARKKGYFKPEHDNGHTMY